VTASAQGIDSDNLRNSGFKPAAEGLVAEPFPVPLLITGLRLGKVLTRLVVSWPCVSTFWLKHFTSFRPASPLMVLSSTVHSLSVLN
jgi:hypothetical protein